MNIAELKQTLTNIASEAEDTDARARLDGIASRAASRKRNKLVAAAAGSVAAVVTFTTIGPQLLDNADEPPTGPAASKTGNLTDRRDDGNRDPADDIVETDLPTVTDNGIIFYTEPAGDTLLGEAVGRPGQRVVSFTATPTTSDLSWIEVCSARVPERNPGLWTNIFVNGNPLGSSGCQDVTGPLQADARFGSSPTANWQTWEEELGVQVGEPSTFEIRLRPGAEKIEALRDAQIGLAVFENTGPRFEDYGVWFESERVVDGHTYRLEGKSFSEFSGGRGEMRVPLPPAEHPLFLAFGVARVAGPYRVIGNAGSSSLSSEGGPSESGTFAEPNQETASMRIRTTGDDGSGLIYILAYKRVD